MIAFLSGILQDKNESSIIIEVSGVGFQVFIPISTYRKLPKVGEPVVIFTNMIVREDDISLYGFSDQNERTMFNLLLSLSGIGAKMALDVLSHLPVFRLSEAVQNDDVTLLCQVPGIGKKRAEKILFDLKRKSHPLLLSPQSPSAEIEELPQNEKMMEVIEALEALGYRPQDAQKALSKAIKNLGDNADIKDLIKEALRHR